MNFSKIFMYSKGFSLSCFIKVMIICYSVCAKRAPLERFLVEEGSKPAIFGSYSYDPIKQVFETPATDIASVPESTPSETSSNIKSTKIESDTTPLGTTTQEHRLKFRKRVDSTLSPKPGFWHSTTKTVNISSNAVVKIQS